MIASTVATALDWRLVDNELVAEVAARAGVSPQEVAEREERPSTFIERLARVTALELPELFLPTAGPLQEHGESSFVRITRSLVEELAAEGRCIVVGRASAAVLARASDTLHVRIVAPKPFRIRRAMDLLGTDREAAERKLEATDSNRIRYHREYYHRDSNDAVNYDMVLNTERLGVDGSSRVILARAEALGWS